MGDKRFRNVYPAVPVRLFAANYPIWKALSKVVVPSIGGVSLLYFKLFQDFKVYPSRYCLDNFLEKHSKRPVLTVSNHMSCLDEPLIWPLLLRYKRILWNWETVRWVPGAYELCYEGSYLKGLFMSFGKTVSCIRGDGIYQPCVDFCIDRLNANHTVHLFVEGKVNDTPDLIRIKWGVGRIVQDTKTPPIIIPFIHKGMEDILPLHHTIPLPGKRFTAVVGDPIDTAPLLDQCAKFNFSRPSSRKYLTDRVQFELEKLNTQANLLHQTQ